jgi:predicted nucleic acid-binding Zn ribbon protein
MRTRPPDRYRCDECGFEAEVTRPTRAAQTSDETLCCCGRCGAEIEITSGTADQERSRRVPQAVPPPTLLI